MNEHVVLVDESNNPIGTADKYEAHSADTPLHRGFSLFIINSKGELLLQKRSKHKKTWPSIWSNSVCGHPALDESPKQAAIRRAEYELGVELGIRQVKLLIKNYRYSYEHLGVVENEICPVMVAFVDVEPTPNPLEVDSTRLVAWEGFIDEISKPNDYSEWCQEEAKLLNKSFVFRQLYKNFVRSKKPAYPTVLSAELLK
jgi:isopentenyl-diphosphate delta-isomerase